jgi:hypothetical protein
MFPPSIPRKSHLATKDAEKTRKGEIKGMHLKNIMHNTFL